MGTQTTILVIDDNEPLLSYLCEYLELGGNRAVPATNGRSGVELFMQESPDIVLVDLKMPDMGGLDFITEIRKINDTVPVIVISGRGPFLMLSRLTGSAHGIFWSSRSRRMNWN